MFKNESTLDRVLRVALGAGLLLLVAAGPRTPWGLIGLVPLLTGVVGFCPLYRLLGIGSGTRNAGPTSKDAPAHR